LMDIRYAGPGREGTDNDPAQDITQNQGLS